MVPRGLRVEALLRTALTVHAPLIAASELTKRFEQNFKKFEPYVGNDVKAAGIHAAA